MKPLLYVDGYNLIGAWGKAEREQWPLDECRDRLVHILEDYAGYTEQEVWVIFDGYRMPHALRSIEQRRSITIVYTKHGETADQYIERQCQELPRYREARVATSDGTEQTLILGRGATRISSREMWNELEQIRSTERGRHTGPKPSQRNSLFAALAPEQLEALEKLRRQKE